MWRDCKEEGERFENQLISLIEKLSHGSVSGADISKQSIEVLTGLLFKHARQKKFLFVFDNVDHYVDLASNKMTGSVDRFIEAFLARSSNSKLFFTCRPFIQYANSAIYSQKLEGLEVHDKSESPGGLAPKARNPPSTTRRSPSVEYGAACLTHSIRLHHSVLPVLRVFRQPAGRRSGEA